MCVCVCMRVCVIRAYMCMYVREKAVGSKDKPPSLSSSSSPDSASELPELDSSPKISGAVEREQESM